MNDATQNSATADKTLDQMAADIAAYQPPAPAAMPATPQSMAAAPAPVPVSAPAPTAMPSPAPVMPATTPAATSSSATTSAPAQTPTSDTSESLEAQNIFELLGVNSGSDADKESFLDELQQVIWEDFLTSDIQLLLTRAELAEVQTIRAQNQDPAKQQEAVVTYLEKLIPDMENIMLEKALELKREMVRERIAGMRSYLAGKPEKLAELDKAQDLMRQDKWATITRTLNSLAAS